MTKQSQLKLSLRELIFLQSSTALGLFGGMLIPLRVGKYDIPSNVIVLVSHVHLKELVFVNGSLENVDTSGRLLLSLSKKANGFSGCIPTWNTMFITMGLASHHLPIPPTGALLLQLEQPLNQQAGGLEFGPLIYTRLSKSSIQTLYSHKGISITPEQL